MSDERPTVTLRFKSEHAKEFFMGQLSDGWGENHCNLRWPWQDGQEFHKCQVFDVDVYSDWGDEQHEIEDEASDRQRQAMKQFEATPEPCPAKEDET